jgi:hypothetical protein
MLAALLVIGSLVPLAAMPIALLAVARLREDRRQKAPSAR